jgi:hypothetical protein
MGRCEVEASGQDRDDRWRLLVSTVKNLRVPEMVGNFLTE